MGEHAIRRLEPAALVAVGGFAGATLRHLLATVLPGLGGTLAANVLGSFLLGVVLYEAIFADLISRQARTVLATGFLSSFTTYSTFALQSVQSRPAVLAANVLANYALGFGAVLLGRAVARRATPDDRRATDDRGDEEPEPSEPTDDAGDHPTGAPTGGDR